MAKDVSEVLKTLQPLRAKLPKKVPPYLQKDWDVFMSAVDDTFDAMDAATGPGDTIKLRADYDALKKKMNTAVAAAIANIPKARAAQAKMMTAANKIGAIVKDKQGEKESKAVGQAIMAYAPYAMREFSGLETPTLIP
jgi:hypothetical protein